MLYHVIGEMEGRVEGIGLTLQDSFGSGGTHFIVNHLYDYASIIETTATGSPTHLNILSGCHPTSSLSVKLPSTRENHLRKEKD